MYDVCKHGYHAGELAFQVTLDSRVRRAIKAEWAQLAPLEARGLPVSLASLDLRAHSAPRAVPATLDSQGLWARRDSPDSLVTLASLGRRDSQGQKVRRASWVTLAVLGSPAPQDQQVLLVQLVPLEVPAHRDSLVLLDPSVSLITLCLHPFNGPFSWTTWVSWYQRGKTNLDFTEARGSEWQWHQLGHMQVCISLQTDNHASNAQLSFLQAFLPPSQQHESTEGIALCLRIYEFICRHSFSSFLH